MSPWRDEIRCRMASGKPTPKPIFSKLWRGADGFSAPPSKEITMNVRTALPAVALLVFGMSSCPVAIADVTIPYNEYSDSPTIGRGAGTCTDPRNPGYGAMRIFIQKTMDYTDDQGPDALPAGQKVIFQRSQSTGRA